MKYDEVQQATHAPQATSVPHPEISAPKVCRNQGENSPAGRSLSLSALPVIALKDHLEPTGATGFPGLVRHLCSGTFIPFPLGLGATKYSKQGMRLRPFHRFKIRPPLRIAHAQFVHQMIPLILKLATRYIDLACGPNATDLPAVKMIAPRRRLCVNDSQVFRDCAKWRQLLLKPNKLGVLGIPFRLAAEHGLGKQSFAPQSNQTAWVKVLWVQTPDAHGCRLFCQDGT
jgi:hypothetical protein